VKVNGSKEGLRVGDVEGAGHTYSKKRGGDGRLRFSVMETSPNGEGCFPRKRCEPHTQWVCTAGIAGGLLSGWLTVNLLRLERWHSRQ